MLETDYLYSNDMIAQCEAAITNLEKENDKLNILKNEILAFVEDEELISRRVSNAKLHFYDYYLICNSLIEANQLDIESYNKLKNEISSRVSEDLCGNVIFSEQRIADRNYAENNAKALKYRELANQSSLIIGSPVVYMMYSSMASHYKERAGYWKQMSQAWEAKKDLFDEVENLTSNLFPSDSESMHVSILKVLNNIENIYKKGEFQVSINATWRNELRNCIESNQDILNKENCEGAKLLNQYLDNKGIYTQQERDVIIEDFRTKYPYLFNQLWILNRKDTTSYNLLLEQIDDFVGDYHFIYAPSEVYGTVNGQEKILYPTEEWGNPGGGNYGNGLNKVGEQYVVAVGPKVLDPNYSDEDNLQDTDFSLPRVIRVVLENKTTGDQKIIECLVCDIKAHTYNEYPTELHPSDNRDEGMASFDVENGIVQTGIAYPNSYNSKVGIQFAPEHINSSIIEFCGGTVDFKIEDYRLNFIIVVEES